MIEFSFEEACSYLLINHFPIQQKQSKYVKVQNCSRK